MSERDLTLDEVKVLSSVSEQDLARWWCSLNRFTPVAELPDAPTWAVMRWIMHKIGHKACLREWNRDTMNDEQFEDFWRRKQA